MPEQVASRRKTTKRKSPREQTEAEYIGALYKDIYRVVRKIPRGKVATYGQVAELAGRPGAARLAGTAMRACPQELGLPWQRVIGKRGPNSGRVSILDPVGAAIQRAILEKEGVRFSASDTISLTDHGWLPTDGKPQRRKRTSASTSKRTSTSTSTSTSKRTSTSTRKRTSKRTSTSTRTSTGKRKSASTSTSKRKSASPKRRR